MTPGGVPCPVCGEAVLASETECSACGARRYAPPTDTLETPPDAIALDSGGQLFAGRYRFIEKLGEGGQARVYRARDEVLEKVVALKLVAPRLRKVPEALARLRREITLAQRVTHANVCRVHDLGDAAGTPFISMELIEGRTLADRLQASGRLPAGQVVDIARQVCSGLAAVHAAGVVHRDLKPQNVMLDHAGRAVIMDLGIANDPEQPPLTEPGSAMGTLAYISPEQARGRPATPLSDIYAVGLVIFEMLTGRLPPADGNPTPLSLRAPGFDLPTPGSLVRGVPAGLDAVVLRCLRTDPAERYASAGELARELALVEGPVSAPSAAPDPAATLPAWITSSWRSPIARFGVAPLVLALMALLAYDDLRTPGPVRGRPTLALTALEYSGPDESDYLEHFLPVAVERALRSSGAVEVAPLESSLGFGSGEPPAEVAASLGVDYLLRGRISVEDQRIVLEAALFRHEGSTTLQQRYASPLTEPGHAADGVAGWLLAQLGLGSVAITAQPRSPEALRAYVEGKRSLEGWDVARNPQRAVEAFSRALVLDGSFAEAHAGLARALWAQYRATETPALVEEARSAAARAVALGASLPESHLALGVVLLGTGQSAEAAASFERARGLAPADDALARAIAGAYAALGRREEALREYDHAIELRPAYWANHNARGTFLLQTGDPAGAELAFDEVIRLRPGSDVGYNNLAAVHLMGGRMELAEPLLKAALAIQPGYRVRNNLGFVYYSTGRFAQAAEEFREATRLAPDRMEAQGNLGDALRQSGRREEAGRAYAAAVRLGRERLEVNADDAEARSGLAMYRAGAGECESADRRRAVEDAPENPAVLYYAAVAAALCGDEDEAARLLSETLARGGGADARTNPDLAPVMRRLDAATDPGMERP